MRAIKRVIVFMLALLLPTTCLPLWLGGQAHAASGDVIITVAGSTDYYANQGDGDLATSSKLGSPADIAFDSGGNMYIVEASTHKVRKVDRWTGIITTVAGSGDMNFSGDGGPATSAGMGPNSIAFDSSDNLYIADGHRVRKVDKSSGIITSVAGTGAWGTSDDGGLATDATFAVVGGIALDSHDNLYISDVYNHRVRKVDKTSGIITTIAGTTVVSGYSGDGGPALSAKFDMPGSLAFDNNGNLYIADLGNNVVRMIDTSEKITTVAGTGVRGFGGDGGQATAAQMNNPTDITFDGNGNLYIVDRFNWRIRKVDKSSGEINTIAGNGGTSDTDDGEIATSSSILPHAIAVDSSGTLYFTDAAGYLVRIIATNNNANLNGLTLSSGSLMPAFEPSRTSYSAIVPLSVERIEITPTVSVGSSTVTVDSTTVTSGTASNAINLNVGKNLIPITVTALDSTTKTYNVQVTRASSDASLSGLTLSRGSLSPTFAAGTPGYTASVGNGVSSIMVTPTANDNAATVRVNGTTVTSASASGAINLSVGSNSIPIVVMAQDGTTTNTYTVTVTRAPSSDSSYISTIAGTGSGSFSGDGGAATAAALNLPMSVAVDREGNLYIADVGNYRIRKLEKSTGKISTVAGNGTFGNSGDGGLATSAQLKNPRGVAVDPDGNVYIADTQDNRIRKVDTSGIISTIAGNGSYGYSGDNGLSTSSQVSMPYRVATDSVGNLYIVDANNFRIRKIDKSTGIITTVVGTGNRGSGGDGGAATSAEVDFPFGLTFDSMDNMYISDMRGATVRKVDHTTGIISKVAGTGTPGYNEDEGQANSADIVPYSVAVDNSGNIYISDASNAVIRKVDQSTGNISTFAGIGENGYSGDGGPATLAELYGPYGLAIDSSGNLLIADMNNHVIRKVGLSHDANLNNITLSSSSLSPAFATGTTSYTANVANGVSSITVTPAVSDYTATVKVNGTVVPNGSASGAINLSVGSNSISIVVKAQDGTTTKTYTVTVTRAPSSEAGLNGLTLSSGSLSPTFATGTLGYAASVANSVSSITVTPTVSESNATVKVNGATVASGTTSGAINLSVGVNEITIVVKAQDGTTTSTYSVTVTRAAPPPVSPADNRSHDANLSGLALSSGSLNPSFASGTTSYAVHVANSMNSITVTPTVSDGTATVKVNGASIPSGSASGAITLVVGDNAISIAVTAQDGTVKTYTVTVTRADEKGDKGSPPATRGPILNDKITNVKQVIDAAQTALNTTMPKPFDDVTASSRSAQAIQVARQLGIVQGQPDGNFHGSDSITRAEFAKMIANALNLDTAGEQGATFSDTKGHWAEKAIEALKATGAIEGVGGGAFKPDRHISRAEITAILARLMVFDQEAGRAAFSDTSDSWARESIAQMADANIVRGVSADKFVPNGSATREQAVVMILRMLTVCRNIDLQLVDMS
ncbi:cadherin-like beta sandwich domain-containing protein [Cohnella soli]|uniref:Cadherin-like beta sandwich domain-containing protein n=1 Tax=Cohnella soli TaxID=425005 RepID=A0ABW0HX55_9BACL